MPIWTVRATWLEDEAEVSDQWAVNAVTADEAVKQATTHIRFQPHHVEAKLRTDAGDSNLRPGEARRMGSN